MTVKQLIWLLRKHPPESNVDLVIFREGDEAEIYTQASDVRIAKDFRGRIVVEITNEA